MINASLVVVGSGIKFLSHLTVEAQAYIAQSDKVLYLVNDPAMKQWIEKMNPNAESLDPLYVRYPLRLHCYRAITNYILESLRKNLHLCVVLYGHPTVFSQPALDAVLQARQEGYYAKVLPGISAEACLFADLLIDPGSCGSQSFETTDFLIHRRPVESSSHLVLWQVGAIGVLDRLATSNAQKKIEFLLEYLSSYYSLDHQVFLYEAAQYACFHPRIDKLSLARLPKMSLSLLTTLYIPPAKKLGCDPDVLEVLNINIKDLQ